MDGAILCIYPMVDFLILFFFFFNFFFFSLPVRWSAVLVPSPGHTPKLQIRTRLETNLFQRFQRTACGGSVVAGHVPTLRLVPPNKGILVR